MEIYSSPEVGVNGSCFLAWGSGIVNNFSFRGNVHSSAATTIRSAERPITNSQRSSDALGLIVSSRSIYASERE